MVMLAGASFEERIRREKAGEPKFNFLKQGDPYYNYFQMKVCLPAYPPCGCWTVLFTIALCVC